MKITPREKRRHAACRLFSRGVIFTRARVSLALLSLRKNGGLLVVYKLTRGGPLVKRRKLPSRDLRLGENKSILPSRPRKKLRRLGDSQTHGRFSHTQQPPPQGAFPWLWRNTQVPSTNSPFALAALSLARS